MQESKFWVSYHSLSLRKNQIFVQILKNFVFFFSFVSFKVCFWFFQLSKVHLTLYHSIPLCERIMWITEWSLSSKYPRSYNTFIRGVFVNNMSKISEISIISQKLQNLKILCYIILKFRSFARFKGRCVSSQMIFIIDTCKNWIFRTKYEHLYWF